MASNLDPSNLFSTEGLIAVVTGGGTGIGLMIAAALENSGATVYIIGDDTLAPLSKEVLENAAKERSKYGKIIPMQGDVTSRDSLLSVVSAIQAQSGYINLLVNNSGTLGPVTRRPAESVKSVKELQDLLWEASPEAFQQAFAVNVTSVYYTTVAFLDLLDKGNQHGSIPGVTSQVITVSSIQGLYRDNSPVPAYQASKAAATHLGKMFANMLKNWDIRSNVIAPGIYPSEMSAGVIDCSGPISHHIIPVKRAGTEEDMAGLILYLASRAGSYVSGNVLITDGGRLSLFCATY